MLPATDSCSKFGNLWLTLHNLPKLPSSKLPNSCSKFGNLWLTLHNVPKLTSSKLPKSCSKFGKLWLTLHNVPKLASSKMPKNCSKFGKCDRICEKGPLPAKLTFALCSFVVGHVDLGRSADFFMNS